MPFLYMPYPYPLQEEGEGRDRGASWGSPSAAKTAISTEWSCPLTQRHRKGVADDEQRR